MVSFLSAAKCLAGFIFMVIFSCYCGVTGFFNSVVYNLDENKDDWWNTAPKHGSFSVEFKFEISPGGIECYYQPISNGSQLFITYEVLTGGDRNVDFLFRDELKQIISHEPWKTEATIEKTIQTSGVYEICFDNSYSRFASKLIYFYMSSFVLEKWEEFVKETEDIHKTVANFSVSLETLQENIKSAMIHLSSSRMHVVLDYYTIMGNNKYVQYWSIVQCIVIISASCLQVFFVKRLFTSTNVTPTLKPRA